MGPGVAAAVVGVVAAAGVVVAGAVAAAVVTGVVAAVVTDAVEVVAVVTGVAVTGVVVTGVVVTGAVAADCDQRRPSNLLPSASPWPGWLACRSALNKSWRNAWRSWARFEPDLELAPFTALALGAEPVLAAEPALAAVFVLAVALVAVAAVAALAGAAAVLALLAAVSAPLAALFDCDAAWVKACSNAVNRLPPPLALPLAAPVDPE